MNLTRAALSAGWQGLGLYRYLIIGVAVVGFTSGCYVAVTRAYDGVYEDGVKAGVVQTTAKYQAQLLADTQRAAQLQHQIDMKNQMLGALVDAFKQMEQDGPAKARTNVRKDPSFAQLRRPVDLAAQRVSELQQLRQAAATH